MRISSRWHASHHPGSCEMFSKKPDHFAPLSCIFVRRCNMLLRYHHNVVASIFYHFLVYASLYTCDDSRARALIWPKLTSAPTSFDVLASRTWKWLAGRQWQQYWNRILTITTTTMAAQRYCPSCLTKASPTPLFRATPRAIAPPSFLRPFHTSSPLAAVQSANAQKYKRKDSNNQALANKKKKKTSTSYATPDLRDALQFSLVDAMRYVNLGAFFSMSTQASNTTFLATYAPPK